MQDFEIIQCENGWIVFSGNSQASRNPFHLKKWVARSEDELADLIKELAKMARLVSLGNQQLEKEGAE